MDLLIAFERRLQVSCIHARARSRTTIWSRREEDLASYTIEVWLIGNVWHLSERDRSTKRTRGSTTLYRDYLTSRSSLNHKAIIDQA